jgi:hypothetical protein
MDVTELTRTYGVVPTTLADFVHDFVASSQQQAR